MNPGVGLFLFILLDPSSVELNSGNVLEEEYHFFDNFLILISFALMILNSYWLGIRNSGPILYFLSLFFYPFFISLSFCSISW